MIFIKGWSQTEIQTILKDFSDSYSLTDSHTWRLEEGNNFAFQLRFPNDIAPLHFFYLINYLNYPIGFNLEGKSLAIRGDCTLTRDFTLPNPDLDGIKASVYTPENDSDFDLVYVHLSSGETYEASFRKKNWKAVSKHRRPAAVNLL